jgi:hypothetical protein
MIKSCSVASGSAREQLNVIGSLWVNLQVGIRQVFAGPSEAQLWYSFMLPGNNVREDTGDAIQTAVFATSTLTEAEVIEEFQRAFASISALFETLFSKTYSQNAFTFNLTPRADVGFETGTNLSSDFFASSYSLTESLGKQDNVGDLRISMIPVDGEGFKLAYAYMPGRNPNVTGDIGGDSRFDQDEKWRLDVDPKPDHTSLQYVATHEFLHNLGMSHDVSPRSVLRPSVSMTESMCQFAPNGLRDCEEYFTVHKAYAGSPFIVALYKNAIYQVGGASNIDPIASFKIDWVGSLQSIGVSPAGYVFGTNSKSLIYFRTNISNESPYGSGFKRINGKLNQISTGALVMGVNPKNIPYVRLGITHTEPSGTDWSRIPGQPLDFIACSPAANPLGEISVFGLFQRKVFYRHGVTFENPLGVSYSNLPGVQLTHITIGLFGALVFGVTIAYNVVRRIGITDENQMGTEWQSVSGNLRIKYLAISPTGELYAVGLDQKVYHRTGMSTSNFNGIRWTRVDIGNVDFLAIGFKIL